MTEDDKASLGRRTVLGVAGAGILGLGAVSGSAASEQQEDGQSGDASGGYDVDEILDQWDQEVVDIAQPVLDKYGDPDEVVPSRLIWHHEDDDAPWTETVMFRDPVPHSFPMEHPDHLEQTIEYHVPPDQYDGIATYDGSVMLERTSGEVSARCDEEALNLLAINLTHELVTTEMTVEDARRAYAEDAMAYKMENEEPPRTQGLQFELPEGDQRDPDVEIIRDGEIVMDHDFGPVSEDDAMAGDEAADDQTAGNATADNETAGNESGQ